MKKPLLVVIAGPTASGKTQCSIALAQHFSTEILSFDSRQCFKELCIGVARPDEAQLAAVPHHFIASHSMHEPMHAGLYEQFALQKLTDLFTRHRLVIATGGTGLYLNAILGRLHPMPDVDEAIRTEARSSYQEKGIDWLANELNMLDPLYASSGEMQNPHRMLRALEVIRSTGRSILSFRHVANEARNFDVLIFSMYVPKPQLHAQINSRVELMMAKGLEHEARSLYAYRHLQALQTVGYTELFDHFESKISLKEAQEQIKVHTRQYAKRQLTWFRKMEEVIWLEPHATSQMVNSIEAFGLSTG